MSHGLPNGFVRLNDEEGNPLTIQTTPQGGRALTVVDPEGRYALERILDAMERPDEESLGQTTMSKSQSVVLAFDQPAVAVDLRRGKTVAFATVSVAGAGDNTIVTADAKRKIKLLSYVLVADAAVTATWKSGASTNLSGAMSLAANGGIASPVSTPAGGWLLETAVNEALVLSLGGAVGCRGHVSYFLEE